MKNNALLKLLNAKIPIFLFLLMFSGCGFPTNNRSECLRSKPSSFGIHAKITINKENQAIPITVYVGPMEENSIYYEKDLNKFVKDIWLKTDTYYTIVAYYKLDGKTYQVVSGITPTVSQSCKNCSNPCYYVENTVVDLRFKP